MLNKVMLIGNLGADPEARYTQDGTCVCNIRLATTERFKGRDGQQQDRTEWHRVVLWGRLGEITKEYLSKGSRVYIEGKIETRKWQDRDGNDKYTTEIRAREMKMLGGGNRSGGGQGGGNYGDSNQGNNQSGSQTPPFNAPPQQQPQQSAPAAPASDPFAGQADFGDIPADDNIPF